MAKSTYNLAFYRYDRRISIVREGENPERFEFDPSIRRLLRREKRIARRTTRREGSTRRLFDALAAEESAPEILWRDPMDVDRIPSAPSPFDGIIDLFLSRRSCR